MNKWIRRGRAELGMSMIEMIIVMGLFSIVGFMIFRNMNTITKFTARAVQEESLQQSLEYMTYRIKKTILRRSFLDPADTTVFASAEDSVLLENCRELLVEAGTPYQRRVDVCNDAKMVKQKLNEDGSTEISETTIKTKCIDIKSDDDKGNWGSIKTKLQERCTIRCRPGKKPVVIVEKDGVATRIPRVDKEAVIPAAMFCMSVDNGEFIVELGVLGEVTNDNYQLKGHIVTLPLSRVD